MAQPPHKVITGPTGGQPLVPGVAGGPLTTLPSWWGILEAGTVSQDGLPNTQAPLSKAVAVTDLLPACTRTMP